MQIIQQITLAKLKKIVSQSEYYNLVKAVVDIEQNILVIDAPMHADLEQFLINQGSKQNNLWGVNIHPDVGLTADCIEFDSMINLRPHQQNFSRNVNDPKIRQKIIDIILSKITE